MNLRAGLATLELSRKLATIHTNLEMPLSSEQLIPAAPVNLDAVCAGRLSRGLVSWQVRQTVLKNYGMEHVPAEEYELDYLITPELGGLASAENLWPDYKGDGGQRVDCEKLLHD